ncbi:MAG: hypothetical protein M1140_05885 [Chloroflexi bacterium]|nr:hypothetical protein [Chloroflexota bacterium]
MSSRALPAGGVERRQALHGAGRNFWQPENMTSIAAAVTAIINHCVLVDAAIALM